MRGKGIFGLGSGRSCEVWWVVGYIFNKELIGCVDELNVECERKRVIKKIFFEKSFYLLELGRWGGSSYGRNN